MTTAVQTEKMSFPSESEATEIRSALQSANPDNSYHIVRVTSGWQVCPVKVLPPFMPAIFKPGPVAGLAEASPEPADTGGVLEYVFGFQRETQAWIWFQDGAAIPWIKKSHLISHKLEDGQVTIRLSKASAIKVGIVKKAA